MVKPSKGVNSTGLATPVILLFASGAAALIYQILWIKQLSLIVGIDVYAVTTAVSAFFAGLGIGSFLFGRRADRVVRPVRLFAFLESAIAVSGVATTVALAFAAAPFAALEARAAPLAWGVLFLLVGVPATLMGGTLAVLIRSLAPQPGQVGGVGGSLYAANTAGAIAGALIAPFLLIPLLGIRGTSLAAATINLTVAFAALACDRNVRPREIEERRADRGSGPPHARLAIVLYAIAGGIALGYEVIWSQAIVQFLSTRAFAFSVVLATYLAGLAAGSALYARWVDRVRDPWSAFGLLIGGAGLVALVQVGGLGIWLLGVQSEVGGTVLAGTGSRLASMSARFAVASIYLVFPTTVLLGAAFPAALRLSVNSARVGRDVGFVVALNTIGGIAGTLLAGFVLVPALGIVRALAALAIAAAAVGVVAAARGSGLGRTTGRATLAIAIAAVVGTIVIPPDRLATLLTSARGGSLVFYAEDRGATVAVVQQGGEQNRFNRLYIQGVSNSGDAMTSLRYMRLQALLPLIVHRGEPRSALVIGLGTGITAGALLAYEGLEQRVAAELLPAVVQAASHFQGNFDAPADPRIEIRVRDGRRELRMSSDRYDLITLEPPPPSAAGVVNLYSREFYELARARLNPDGLLAQWWPLPTQNDEDSRSMVRSFLDVFPYASVWTTELHEMLLIGSLQPIELDVRRITERFEQPAVARALREVGVASPAALLATWVTDRAGLERYAGDAPAVTDDDPRIEYATWVRPDEIARVLPDVLALRTDPPLVNGDEAFAAAVGKERSQLLDFYTAGLHAYKGERNLWARAIDRVMSEDGDNPYYRWMVGGR